MSNPQEPSASNAVKIAQALNVSVEYLVTGKEIENKIPMTKEVIDFLDLYFSLTPPQKDAIQRVANLFSKKQS